MKLIIAEKPELGRDIAKAILQSSSEKHGVIENDEYAVTWAYGHLLELVEPEEYDEKYKNWREEDLPIHFDNWKKRPVQDIVSREGNIVIDNAYKRERLKTIGELLNRSSCVIHAGDPDEEGQNLIDEILDYFHYQGIVKRVFVNDNIEKNIRKSFDKLIDNKQQKNISNSAYARQMCDKCHGINHSRLATIRLHKRGLSIGRVQTATLGLVVNRDIAILNHIKEKYYDLEASYHLDDNENEYENVVFKFKPSKELLAGDKHIGNKDTLENIKGALNGPYMCATTVKEKETYAPLPYNQTILSIDMNKLYGYSLKQTLDITQSLRDKHKAITYNRSDSQYLKEEHFKEAPGVTQIIMKNLNCKFPLSFENKSSCFNDEFAPNHHGIIPQEKEIDLNKLSIEERNVYLAISFRYLAQFLPPQVSKVSSSSIIIKEGIFVHNCNSVIDLGWKKYYETTEDNLDAEKDEKDFIEEGNYHANLNNAVILEKETKPLSKYSQGSLVKDMTSISKYVKNPILKKALQDKDKNKKDENGSIGTVATRASIIETLVKRKFIEQDGKYIVSTELGRDFYNLIPEKIKTADVTAKWWLIQEAIITGDKEVNDLMREDVKEFESIKNAAYLNGELKQNIIEKESIGNCPFCNSLIYEGKGEKGKSWYCSAYKDGCKFRLYEKMKRFEDTIVLNTTKVTKLINGKTIDEKLTAKNGNKYCANLKIKGNKGYASFEIDSFVNKNK